MRSLTDEQIKKYGHAPKQGQAKYIKDLRALIQECEAKNGIVSQTSDGLYAYWNTVLKQRSVDPLLEKPKRKSTASKDSEAAKRNQRFENIKKTYGNLRGTDVKFTLKHDDWRLQIDKDTEDQQRMQEYEKNEKQRENKKMVDQIRTKFQKHEDQEWKEFMEQLNQKWDKSEEMKKKKRKKKKITQGGDDIGEMEEVKNEPAVEDGEIMSEEEFLWIKEYERELL